MARSSCWSSPLNSFAGIVIDHDVGIDAVALDDPVLAVLRIGRELRPEELAAISQRKRIANADDAAPGAFADQFAKAHRLEAIRENVAVGGGELVTERDHRADEGLRRIRLRRAVARDLDHDERAPEPLDDERRNKAAAISAHIDDESFLFDLREVLLGEFVQARLAHVGDVDIADFAVGFLADFIDVLLHPGFVIERRFVGGRHNGDVARAVVRRFGINAQDDLLVGGADKRVIKIRQSGNRRAVDRENVIARLSRSHRCAVSGERVCLSQFSPGRMRSMR